MVQIGHIVHSLSYLSLTWQYQLSIAAYQITSKFNGLKTTLLSHNSCVSINLGPQFGWILRFRFLTRLQSVSQLGLLLSQGLTGAEFAFKVIHVIVGRIQVLLGFWLEVPSVHGMWASLLGPLTQELNSSEPKTELGSASYHSCCILLIRSKSLDPAHVQGEEIIQGMRTPENHLKDCLPHHLLHRCVSFGVTFLFEL